MIFIYISIFKMIIEWVSFSLYVLVFILVEIYEDI